MPEKEPKRLTVIDLAAKYGVGREAVYEWVRALGLKPDNAKRYLVAPIVELHVERERSKLSVDEHGNLEPPSNYSDLLKAKQVEKLQVQIDELRGRTWLKEDVLTSWTERNTRMTSTIENWRQGESERDGTVEGKARIDGLADLLLSMLSEEFEQ
jgi:hypothetical protein